ncbi:MAG TPA: Cof-type HAD-IIB family hydrolase [Longilinea sp.]|nr:Cof-type HAD-IIB family hydrolase [Longilinea sp.]
MKTQTHNIRLIATDLDGTLFNSQRVVSPTTLQVLKRVQQAGIQIMLTTGRPFFAVSEMVDSWGMDLPLICSGGAFVTAGKNGPVISEFNFHMKAELDFLLGFARQHDALMVGETKDLSIWFASDNFIKMRPSKLLEDTWHATRTLRPEVDFDRPFLKMCFIVAKDKVDLTAEAVASLQSLDYAYAGYEDFDLTAKGVNKGNALKAYAEYAGIPREQIAAFGDQLNDVSLLEYAGLPIAVENAQPAVKAAAKWVMPSNDEDGVAQGMERILAEYSNQ